MNLFRITLHIVIICTLLQLSACSKKEKPVSSAAPGANKALINVMYDAVTFYANGGQVYQPPPGTTITKKSLIREEGGSSTVYLEIGGMEQKGSSLAVIAFRFPETWLSTEKQKLGDLETEIKELTACTEKLRTDELKGKAPRKDPDDSCKMLEITANGKSGITIRDDKVKHIEMLVYSLK